MLLGGKEGVHIKLASEIELGVGPQDKIGEAKGLKFTDDCRAD
jgi:hypothetical protein